jgi:Helix-turn-helix domain
MARRSLLRALEEPADSTDDDPSAGPLRRTYDAQEVAALFGVSLRNVYRAVREHQGPIGTLAIKVGQHRVVFPKAAVDRLLDEGPMS